MYLSNGIYEFSDVEFPLSEFQLMKLGQTDITSDSFSPNFPILSDYIY